MCVCRFSHRQHFVVQLLMPLRTGLVRHGSQYDVDSGEVGRREMSQEQRNVVRSALPKSNLLQLRHDQILCAVEGDWFQVMVPVVDPETSQDSGRETCRLRRAQGEPLFVRTMRSNRRFWICAGIGYRNAPIVGARGHGTHKLTSSVISGAPPLPSSSVSA